ncbi:MAG: neutral/alkaline non-lysosomal ceramidase N-terminal domain-containing protein [Pirellulaceae bacterium]|nr:neutral/alkaline non-lysosomal ceramidase N-terminal domain-containing protein [Pirellulaceae bacterium]
MSSAAVLAQEATWRAGTARENITPAQLMWMSGYGNRDRPAEDKLTDLWAKALAVSDPQGQRAVWITLDLVGIDRTLSASICRQLEQKYGLRRDQVALSTSHTHTGPVVGLNLGPLHYLQLDEAQRKLIDDYAADLEQRVVAMVGHALHNLEPCRLAWGSGSETFAVNRRNNKEADVPQLRAAGMLRGPSDHDVPVLAVKDAAGRLKAVVFGYACHATVLSFYKWSGDYPGFAQIELERRHPGCQAMFFAGCGGDQNPLPRREVRHAEEYGQRLAAAVDAVLSDSLQPVSGSLRTTYEELALPLDKLPERAELERQSKSANRSEATRARMLLERLDREGMLSATYPYPVSVWHMGPQVQVVFLGGEVVVDYAVRLKSELRGKQTWVSAYSNDVMAYIPSRRVLQEGGYEGGGAMVYYGLPTVWSPEVEQTIVDGVHQQIKPAE